jgi:hypothetical protein
VSAVDQLISTRAIETEATKQCESLVEDFKNNNKDEFLELLKASKNNLELNVKATITELLIDEACDEKSKAISKNLFQLKNTLFYTSERIKAIDNLIAGIEEGDKDGAMPTAD